MSKTLELSETTISRVRQDIQIEKRLVPMALFAVFLLGLALIQFATPDMPDNDGFYHIKMAWLMRTEGLKPAFPYLPLSILNEKAFYDHHFLFHVALIPFTFGDLRMGAKWAAVTFAALAFLAVWYLFDRQRIPYEAVAGWIKPVRALVTSVSEGLFAGMLDFNKLPLSRDTLKLHAVVALGIFPKDDRRDWNAVRAWAESIHPLLLQ